MNEEYIEDPITQILLKLDRILDILDTPKYSSRTKQIIEGGCEYMNIDPEELNKGGGGNLERELIVLAIRQHTNTTYRYLSSIWGYANESFIYQLYQRAYDKIMDGTGQEKDFQDKYENICSYLKL